MPNLKKTKTTVDEPEFTIRLSRGLANRRRLPLDHVLAVLKEFQELVKDVGKALQREAGIKEADGDFGIQLLAKAKGDVFRAGSITATGALTRNVVIGSKALDEIVSTTDAVEKKRPVSLDNSMRVRIVKSLAKIGDIQREDRTEFSVEFKSPGQRKKTATISESGIQVLQKIESETVRVDGITIYGKLFDLRDRSKTDDLGEYIWGELRTDGGEVWRVRFDSRHAKDVADLFSKQVKVVGDAVYSKTRNPQLHILKFSEDDARDYLAAFDELEGADADLYGSDNLEDLMNEARGDV
ncbi:MAG: hypothetical protein ACE14M_16740 [Terriglobales bacterium]